MHINTHFSSQQLDWLEQKISEKSKTSNTINNITSLAGDAGFRRYYRITDQSHKNYIFVDASAEPKVFQAYCLQTQHLNLYQIPIPKIIHQNNQLSCALLTDYGDDLLFNLLNQTNAENLYTPALDTLNQFHQCDIQAFGRYKKLDQQLMFEELLGFQEWYLEKYLNKSLSNETKKNLANQFELIIQKIIQQPYVLIHRDYHSKNIFVLDQPNKSGDDSGNGRGNDDSYKKIGLIDFQDAMAGPVTYDLASLLRDCYIDVLEKNNTEKLVLYYKSKNQLLGHINNQDFIHYFNYTSIQRQLKAICTFARKAVRDNNANYLQYIPNTLKSVFSVASEYPELKYLASFIGKLIRE